MIEPLSNGSALSEIPGVFLLRRTPDAQGSDYGYMAWKRQMLRNRDMNQPLYMAGARAKWSLTSVKNFRMVKYRNLTVIVAA